MDDEDEKPQSDLYIREKAGINGHKGRTDFRNFGTMARRFEPGKKIKPKRKLTPEEAAEQAKMREYFKRAR